MTNRKNFSAKPISQTWRSEPKTQSNPNCKDQRFEVKDWNGVNKTLVYHFTDTARLPWILASGELRPGKTLIGDDFLWATTNEKGDRTASIKVGADADFRSGLVRAVRFTLDGSDFENWPVANGWPPEYVDGLEEEAKRMKVNPNTWRVRRTALSDRIYAIDTKAWNDNKWRSLESCKVYTMPNGFYGVEIGGKMYASKQRLMPGGLIGYEIKRPIQLTRECRVLRGQ
jgi:hypothetical protein